jgi:predicted nucleic acid-binding protein
LPSRAVMSDLIVFDTSVLIDDQRTARHAERMANLTGLVRNSSVVMAELWRGAIEAAERNFVRALERSHPILAPTTKNWLESGQILAKMQEDNGFEPHKLRDLHFDVLIALTARSNGARVITSNRADFELIRKYREFALEIW